MTTTAVDVAWLERLAEDAGAKVEFDAEGSVIVSPATDDHLVAAHGLYDQLLAYCPPALRVFMEGPRWNPLGTERPSYVPDLCVVDAVALKRPRGDYGLTPPPSLIIEVVSPESRRRDLIEKADRYFAGGAAAYWTVEVPSLADVHGPELTMRRRGDRDWDALGPLQGLVEVNHPFDLRIDLSRLTR